MLRLPALKSVFAWPFHVLTVMVLVSLACSFGSAPKSGATPVPAAAEASPTTKSVQTEPTATHVAQAESPLPSPTVVEGEELATEQPSGDQAQSKPAAGSREGMLELLQGEFWPQETIQVTLKASQPMPEGAWVGVLPAGAPHGVASENDELDSDYEMVEGIQSGTTELTAPNTPGAYEVRLIDPTAELGRQELDTVGFTVVAHDVSDVSLELDKTSYGPGEEIQVSYTAPDTLPLDAWIGLVPSPIAHGDSGAVDAHDVDFEYLSGVPEGILTLTAPSEPGDYDVRMFDSAVTDGKEITFVTLKVVAHDASQASLSLKKNILAPGDEFEVTFTAPASLPDDAWVGILPADVAHGSESEADGFDLGYEYLEGQVSGTFTFVAPEDPGKYDVRMFDTDSEGVELTSISFEVR